MRGSRRAPQSGIDWTSPKPRVLWFDSATQHLPKAKLEPHPNIRQVKCPCGMDMTWASRPGSAAKVPLDPRAVCFLVFLVNGEPRAVTLREFQLKIDSIRFKDGSVIAPERILAMHVTHFATCKDSAAFSRRYAPKA